MNTSFNNVGNIVTTIKRVFFRAQQFGTGIRSHNSYRTLKFTIRKLIRFMMSFFHEGVLNNIMITYYYFFN